MADPYAAFSSPAQAGADPYAAISSPAPTDAGATPPPEPAARAMPGMAGGIGQQALQGATFGFSDELQGLVAAGIEKVAETFNRGPFRVAPDRPPVPLGGRSFGDAYRDATGRTRQDLSAFAEANPVTATAAQVAGGLATGGGLLKGTAAIGAPVTGIKGALALGGTAGGVAGAGSAEEGSRIEGAIKGALMGAGVGGTLAGGGHVLSSMWRKLAPPAQEHLVKLAKASGLTPQEIETRLYALGPKATLADVSDSFRAAADVAATRLGPTMRKIQELTQRDRTQFGRLMEPIKRIIGGVDDSVDTIGKLKAIRQQQASPLYEAAFAKPVQLTPRLKDLLSRPETQKAWRRVQSIGRSDPDVDVALMRNGADPSFRGLQEITEKLRDRANSLARGGFNKDAKIIGDLRRAMLSEMDDQSPEFAKARSLWADTKQADDAIEAGRGFLNNKTAADVAEEFAGMGEADKVFYRLGMGRAIEEKMAAATDTRDLSLMFRSPAFRDKVRVAFPDVESAVDFLNTVQAEAVKKATTTSVGRNSQTAVRQAAAKQLGGGEISIPDTSKQALLARMLGSVTAPRERTIQELGGMLLAQDRPTQAQAIAAILEGVQSRPMVISPTSVGAANIAGQNSGF